MSKQEIWELFLWSRYCYTRQKYFGCFGCCVDYWLCYFLLLTG